MGNFTKICWQIPGFVEIGQQRTLYADPTAILRLSQKPAKYLSQQKKKVFNGGADKNEINILYPVNILPTFYDCWDD
jgi:hypothetical protein